MAYTFTLQSIIHFHLRFKLTVPISLSRPRWPPSLFPVFHTETPDCWRYGLRHNGATCPVRYTSYFSQSACAQTQSHTHTKSIQISPFRPSPHFASEDIKRRDKWANVFILKTFSNNLFIYLFHILSPLSHLQKAKWMHLFARVHGIHASTTYEHGSKSSMIQHNTISDIASIKPGNKTSTKWHEEWDAGSVRVNRWKRQSG